MNIDILLVDIISILTILFLSRLVFKSLIHPIAIICLWWNGFLLLSNIYIIGEAIPLGTHAVFLLFIYSILLFGVLFHLSCGSKKAYIPNVIIKNRVKVLILLGAVYFISLYLGYKGYVLAGIYGPIFRNLSFSSGGYTSLLYGTYYLQTFASLILPPLVLFEIISLAIIGILYKKYVVLIMGLILAIAVCFQSMGRFPLYYFTLATVLTLVIAKKKTFRSFLKASSVLFVAIILFLCITSQRYGDEGLNRKAIENSIDQAVLYHVLGFNLFNHELSDEGSVLNRGTSFGRLSLLAYPDTVLCMFLRRFGISISPEIDYMAEHWQTSVDLGYDYNGNFIATNAFYTTLYPIFYDFGYIGIILIPGIFAYFIIAHFKTYSKEGNIISLFIVVFLMIFLMTSIFNSKITSFEFIVIFYFILRISPLRLPRLRSPS